MHVAIVTPAYLPLPGGGERYVGALAHGLAARGVAVTVVTSAATAEADLWNGVAVNDGATVSPLTTMPGDVHVIRLPISPFPGRRRVQLFC